MPGVTLSPTELRVNEAGGTGQYTIVLDSRPGTNRVVTVTPESNDPNVATVSGPLSFTGANWYQPQEVTVTLVDDTIINRPPRTVVINHSSRSSTATGPYHNPSNGPSNSGDPKIIVGSVTVTAIDNESGVSLSRQAFDVPEGGEATYTIVLNDRPTHPVTITPTIANNPGIIISGPLTFTIANWNQPQTVRVTGVEDAIDNDPRRVVITNRVLSADLHYNGLSLLNTAILGDNDTAGVTLSTTDLSITEAGGVGTYTVALNTRPTDNVTITPTSRDETVVTVSNPLMFTPLNWSVPQEVTGATIGR